MGHFVSKETRAKLSTTFKGRKITWADKIRKTLTGRHASDEIRLKISKSLKKHYKNPESRNRQRNAATRQWMNPEILNKVSGPNSCAWRGGIHVPYGPEFRNRLKNIILQRDGFLCQNPGCYLPENGRHHDVHHIDFDKKHNDPVNLITLCRSCHAKTTHGDRKNWMDHYRGLQGIRGLL
jgi:hypothetical protein